MGLTGGLGLGGKGLADMIDPSIRAYASTKLDVGIKSPFSTTEKLTPEKDVTTYNNFYEFGTEKDQPAKNAQKFQTSPWIVSIEGEVEKQRTLTMDDILKAAPLEERIYRHRCVEGWSIVVPWIGYSFSTLANLAGPKPTAKFVAFQSFFDMKQMPLWRDAGIQLPYVEGLRMDEAMHPLTMLCVGMYGETLP